MDWWTRALDEPRRYREFTIQRRSGGQPRVIHAPIKPIRDMQSKLRPMLEAEYEPWPHVHGFVTTRSAVSNAAVHRGQRWVLRIDLKDFFPSIHFGRVRGLLMSHPFDLSPDVATTVAHICCHKGILPQGAPTSPTISNLVCRGLDVRLAKFASAVHCSYSRYADDICFSTGRREFPRLLAEIIDDRPVLNPDLRSIVEGETFKVNEAKTLLMPRFQRQRVTGLVVNKKLSVGREYYRHLRAVLYIWAKYGQPDAEKAFARARPVRNWPPGKDRPDFAYVVRGQLQYLGFVRGYDGVYQRLAQQLRSLDQSFNPTLPKVPKSGQVVFAGEGPSDAKHLFAALNASREEMAGLDFVELSHRAPKSDDQLWEWLQSLKDSRNLQPRVGIFDSDTPKYPKEIGESGWKHLGNGVVAVLLARPPTLSSEAFCIEMLHSPQTLRLENDEDRRIFLRDEFDVNGDSVDGRFRMRHPQKKTLVVENVIRNSDGKSVGLGKVAFADAVYGRVAPYGSVDFAGFAPTLQRLREAVAVAQTGCS